MSDEMPRARQDELVVQSIGDETIVYDERRSRAHRLNQTAAFVWSHCDGARTVADLAAAVQKETGQDKEIGQDKEVGQGAEDIVWLALDRLEKAHLLQDRLAKPAHAAPLTRRDVLRKAALAGGLTLLLPVVQSIVAPTPAMAMSIGCAKRGQIPSPTRPCCPGLRDVNGICVGRGGQG
jgi:hypothetical protein